MYSSKVEVTGLQVKLRMLDDSCHQWQYYGGAEGVYPPLPKLPGGHHAVLTYNLYGTASKPYIDQEMDIRTFCVTQDRRTPPIQPNTFCGLMDSRTHMLQCVGKEQSIPAVNISTTSPRVRDSTIPQPAEYIRPTDLTNNPLSSFVKQTFRFYF